MPQPSRSRGERVAKFCNRFFREGKVGANFVIRSTDKVDLQSCVDTLCDGLATSGYDFTPGGI